MSKPPKCKVCKTEYPKFTSTQKVCSTKCALALVKQANDKEFRKETKRLKEKIKSRSEWLKQAQTVFNKFIRLRDKGKPCISCDKPDNGLHQRHASHYRSVAACSQLRFNTFNVHSSCSTCNSILSGNLLEYRIRLIKKLGKDRVEWLENQNEITRYDIEYLKRLKKIFNKMVKKIINKV